MSDAIQDVLQDVVDEVFASLAFLMPLPPELAEGADEPDWVTAVVGFDGPANGEVRLRVERGMLAALAGNMLGVDDMTGLPTEDQQQDAVRELLNVLCGNLLPRLAGEEAEFRVHPPRMLDGEEPPEPAWATLADVATCTDEGRTEVLLLADRPLRPSNAA